MNRLAGLCQTKLALAATDGKNKKYPWQAKPLFSVYQIQQSLSYFQIAPINYLCCISSEKMIKYQ